MHRTWTWHNATASGSGKRVWPSMAPIEGIDLRVGHHRNYANSEREGAGITARHYQVTVVLSPLAQGDQSWGRGPYGGRHSADFASDVLPP